MSRRHDKRNFQGPKHGLIVPVKVQKRLLAQTRLRVFDCPAQGTLTFLRDVLSDGETPSPWSWSGYERIPTDVSVDKYLDQWRENELRRRERARKRAERNGTPDSTAELRSVDIASEELRPRLVQAKNIAEDGFAKQKACLLGRVLVFDRNAHPLFDPYATTKSCSNKTVDCVSSARRNKKALSTLTIENQTLNERMLTEAITELEIQDAEARPSGPASEVNKKHIFKPLQKDPAAQAMNGELWCHSNIGQLLPPSLKEEWISFCSRYEARNCRLFDAFAKSSSAAGQSIENCEDDVQDSEPASLFGTTFYFNGLQRDKDGARLVNFNRPVPLYALSRHRNSNDNTRADRVRTRNRPGEGPVEFLGWFRLTSLRLVAPHSPELIRMLEIKDGAKGFKKQRSKEAWAKSLSTAWARIGIERIRTKTFTIGHDETAREVLLMDPSMASGCPDELEAYISKLAGLQTS
ncbi:hypothetical protein K437DRAFT_276958 [Tilletiaria anomala UBC 951]|uniref:Uncharacterized protein n=1 Tax=Tilletiaria anomala (strain ATCC 24038 / CBS 436.72 / UBC 951) TaxID=1037660 RepID=A0A066V5Z5_TILAU|nr:uncharacterized protein K437DRAFT_276958 [Tilletiaria anomala UBC 951]KDN35678.1 hypothetical protein K437DRAFT_276958 [Tilletiaria anomala UBC 951]